MSDEPRTIDHFDWLAMPVAKKGFLLAALKVEENGYSKYRGGASLPLDENLCGVDLLAGWYVIVDAGLKVMPGGSFAGPKPRLRYGKLSRATSLVVGRRVGVEVSCELWGNGRRRWTAWTTPEGVASDGVLPEDLKGQTPARLAHAICGFDPTVFPLPTGERFIRL